MLSLTLNYYNYFAKSKFSVVRKAPSARNSYASLAHNHFSLLTQQLFYSVEHILKKLSLVGCNLLHIHFN